MNFNEFKINVINWSRDRKIIPNSTAYMQALKLLSEYGELCDAVAKGNRESLIDAIGDVSVCAVNYAAIHNVHTEPKGSTDYYSQLEQHQLIGIIGDAAIRLLVTYESKRAKIITGDLLEMLKVFAAINHLDFNNCLSVAWNEIKDRTGYMNENGVFIKDESV